MSRIAIVSAMHQELRALLPALDKRQQVRFAGRDFHLGQMESHPLVIVKKDEALTEAQVREYCKINLTGYKQPKVVEFRTELPKTPVGKILRRELRDKKIGRASCRERV